MSEPKNPPRTKPLRIEYLPLATLAAAPRNPRQHSKKQINQIANSIHEFGFTNPVLIDPDHVIIAGHGRVEAAKQLGLEQVPTIQLSHLTPTQRRALVIADNRIGLNSSWDTEILTLELQEIQLVDQIDLETIGFDTCELDLLLSPHAGDDGPIEEPATSSAAITRTGDIWVLGAHRLICADARDPNSYRALLRDERAQMLFTDPPYNVPIEGHVSGLGKIKHREFAMASGEMTDPQFDSFLTESLSAGRSFSLDGAIHFVCMDWRHLSNLLAVGKQIYTELKNICVWNKSNAGMGSLYRSKHELICVFKVGTSSHINNIELGRHGRYRTNVWDYPGANAFNPARAEELNMHPTMKPVSLIADAIKDCSLRNDIILDQFGGSGTTLIAAEKCARHARTIEIDPVYVDVAVRRWQRLTGRQAIREDDNQSFDSVSSCDVSESRAVAAEAT